MKPWFKKRLSVFKETGALWLDSNAFQLSAALAFYTLLSLAPLLLVLITVTGIFFGEDAATGQLAAQIEEFVGPDTAEIVQDAVRRSRIEEAGILPTVVGLGALLFGATTVLAQMQSALNRIWGVAAAPSRSGVMVFLAGRALSLLALLLIGAVLLATVLLTAGVSALVQFAEEQIPLPPGTLFLVDILGSMVLATGLFATVFKLLPDAELEWRDMWRGATLTAVLFVVGQFLISQYLTRAAPGSAYGAAGSLVVLLVWVYYSSLILFFGAAFTKVSMLQRGRSVIPRRGGVRTRTEIVEETEEGTETRRVPASGDPEEDARKQAEVDE